MTETRPPRLFISYSHRDERFRQELDIRLAPLKRRGELDVWSDRRIGAGQEWEKEISESLDHSDIIILLVSPDFLASDFCYHKELKRAMQRHEAGAACVIPVFVRDCDWKDEVFGKLQGVLDDAHPVDSPRWPSLDQPLKLVARAIREAAETHRARVAERLAAERAAAERAAAERAAAERLAAERRWPDLHVFRDRFGDGGFGPEMVVLPAGEFLMGSPDSDTEAFADEKPQHLVRIGYRFAVGRYPVTFEEWDACVADGGVDYRPDDQGWGRGRRPVTDVSWEDTKQYLVWLSRKTGRPYRLLSEAEWEYAARGGTSTRRWWGDDITPEKANYFPEIGSTTEVGTYPENPFKLYDVLGNVWEWVDDCYKDSYSEAPRDGSARQTSDKNSARVLRGGSWFDDPRDVRSANRNGNAADLQVNDLGFRVARTL